MKIVTLNVLFFTFLTLPDSAHNVSSTPFEVNNIVLKSFLASADGKSARLTWELAEMEQDVSCYIERSGDGRKFNAIETMSIKKGFSGVMSFVDQQLNPGVYYYRLNISKQGFIPYKSDIISIRISKQSEMEKDYRVINPFDQQITIIGKFGVNPLQVEVSDITGRVRISRTINPISGKSISISASSLDKGTYILRIREEKAGLQALILTKHIVKN